MDPLSPAEMKNQMIRGGCESYHVCMECWRKVQSATADDYAIAAAEALRHPNCKVESIDFVNLGITDVGARALGTAMPFSSTLQVLYLGLNKITGVGAKFLAAGAAQSKTLKKLHLSGNATLGPDGVKAFAECNPPLELLDLEDTGIGNEGMCFVSELLLKTQTLQHLSVGWNGISDTGPIANALAVNSSLKTLSMVNKDINDHGILGLAKAITRNKHLEVLELRRNEAMTDVGGNAILLALTHNEILRELDIDGTNISKKVSRRISELSRDVQDRRRRLLQRMPLLLMENSVRTAVPF